MSGSRAAAPSTRGRRDLDIAARIGLLDWEGLTGEIDTVGHAQTDRLLTPAECAALRDLYDRPELFRSTIDLARYRFGSGPYRYFDHPLPEPVSRLREAFYPRLLDIARAWAARLGRAAPWPDSLDRWLDLCHQAGQTKPTPILLRYGAGDWNALHRDLYGDLVFPLQVVIGLDEPGVDHTGGEFLMVEQRARAQSRGYASILRQGHAIVFTTRDRPVPSQRGVVGCTDAARREYCPIRSPAHARPGAARCGLRCRPRAPTRLQGRRRRRAPTRLLMPSPARSRGGCTD